MNRKSISEKLTEYHNEYDRLNEMVTECEGQIDSIQVECSSIQNTIKQVELDRESVLREMTTLELDVNELRGRYQRKEEVLRKNQSRKEDLETEFAMKQSYLQENLTPQLNVIIFAN